MQTRQLLLQPHQWGLNQILKQVKIVPFCLLPAAPWDPRLPGPAKDTLWQPLGWPTLCSLPALKSSPGAGSQGTPSVRAPSLGLRHSHTGSPPSVLPQEELSGSSSFPSPMGLCLCFWVQQ